MQNNFYKTSSDIDNIKIVIDNLKEEIKRLEAELEFKTSSTLQDDEENEPLYVKKILKIDYENRKIIRYKRYVNETGKVVKREKKEWKISVCSFFDERDRESTVLLLNGGFYFSYVKKSGRYVPVIISDRSEVIILPKDFPKRLFPI